MSEYYCEQLTNATYKCSEIVAESSSDSAFWIALGFLLLVSIGGFFGILLAD